MSKTTAASFVGSLFVFAQKDPGCRVGVGQRAAVRCGSGFISRRSVICAAAAVARVVTVGARAARDEDARRCDRKREDPNAHVKKDSIRPRASPIPFKMV
jgi:hypothetical protein